MKIKKQIKTWLKKQKVFHIIWESPPFYRVRGIVFSLGERLNGYQKERQIFEEKHGYELDLKNPSSFNQKLVWKKIYDRNPLSAFVADKYKAREYVELVLGKGEAKNLLVPLLYATDDPGTIPFDELPGEYVIKTNHGSGQVIFVRKGTSIDREQIMNQLKNWLERPYGLFNHEWVYRGIKRMVLIEKLLVDENGQVPKDYKFFIFYGKCLLVQVDHRRFTDHTRSLFDHDWNYLRVALRHKRGPKVKKPKNFEKMRSLAEKLGENFDHIRVDLYEVNDKIYFGELTNYHGAGREEFDPQSFDFELGSKWDITPDYWKKSEYIKKFSPRVRKEIYGK